MNKEDVVHIYNGILLSHKKEIMPFATTWISEATKKAKDKYHMIMVIKIY